MDYNIFLNWSKDLLTGFAKLGNWLVNPLITLGNVPVSPLLLFSGSGLLIFIAAAIIKWVVS